MRMPSDWGSLTAILMGASVLWGAHLALMRLIFRGVFAPARALGELVDRVDKVEERLTHMVTHQDMRDVSARIDDVRRNVSVQEANLGGIKDSLARVEHMVNLLLTAQLEGSRG